MFLVNRRFTGFVIELFGFIFFLLRGKKKGKNELDSNNQK